MEHHSHYHQHLPHKRYSVDKTVIIVAVFITLCLLGFYFGRQVFKNANLSLIHLSQRQVLVYIGHTEVRAEVADNPDLHAKGLSGHAPLAADEGMWFVFNKHGFHGFWMKDMTFPIDIIWLDAGLDVVDIEENVLPESYPQVYYPEYASLYVLEVPSGFVAENKINIGDRAQILSETLK